MNIPASPPALRTMILERWREKDRKWIWAAGALVILLIAALYRLLTFIPQPLDSPQTLRHHVYSLFNWWIKRYPDPATAEASWARICFYLLLVPAGLVLFNFWSARRHRVPMRQILCSRSLLFGSIALALIANRLPVLLFDQMNPDEGQFLAAAEKLFVDPIFFRSVDCGTTGPFNIYPLMLPALVGLPPDLASGRAVGMLMILVAIFVLYKTFLLFVDDSRARVAILPVAGIFAVFRYFDLLHYTSEHVALLETSLAVYLCARVFVRPTRFDVPLFGLGLLCTVAFFAKMQAVPIIAMAALLAIACVYRSGMAHARWRPIAALVAGAVPIPAIHLIISLLTGTWHDFWMSYVVTNTRYAAPPEGLSTFVNFVLNVPEFCILIVTLIAVLAVDSWRRARSKPETTTLALFLEWSMIGCATALAAEWLLRTANQGATYAYLGAFCLIAFAASIPLLFLNMSRSALPVEWFGRAAVMLLAASWYAVYAPHYLFPHYLLLLIIPFGLAIAWPLLRPAGSAEEPTGASGTALVFAFATVIVAGQIFLGDLPFETRFAKMPTDFGESDTSDFVRWLTKPSSPIVVWGWTTDPYLESGRVAATRDLNMANFLHPDPEVRAFYQDRFLRDMQRAVPVLVIEASGPRSFGGNLGQFWTRQTGSFEQIPAINSFIQAHYVLIADADDERFYLRGDAFEAKAAEAKAAAAALTRCAPNNIRCFDDTPGASDHLPLIKMPAHAMLETVFTPDGKEEPNVTVFSNDLDEKVPVGFHFVSVGGDVYQLALGLGKKRILSEPLVIPQKMPAILSIEFQATTVVISLNGVKREEMHLPAPLADSIGPITIGTYMGVRPFAGKIRMFQIRDLGQPR